MGDQLEKIEELRELLTAWQHEYYVLGKPSVTDLEYDTAFNELLSLESMYPGLQTPDSPTARVGSDLSSDLPEVEHSVPVLSLDKRYTAESVIAWVAKLEKDASQEGNSAIQVVAEEKLDGVSIVLYYEEGVLVRGVTRGNGYRGNDVTENIKTIGAVPLRLPKPITLAVRGEIYIPISKFTTIKERVDYANPRNLAAGSIRRKQSSLVADMPLSIFVYEGFSEELPTHHEGILEELVVLGFRVNRWQSFSSQDDPQKIISYLENLTEERPSLDYEIDGVVFKVSDLTLRERLGYTGHHPKWAMAWKFEAPEAETVVTGIDIQIGRSGRVTPVARVTPVEVGGATVSNITLHNRDYIEMLGLSLDDRVAISRRGDVIPAVERVVEPSGNSLWHMPTHCPSCGSILEDRGAHTFCPNYHCPDQVYGRILFFVGRNQMDIDGLGSQTIRTLIDSGFIKDIPDIYRVQWDKVAELPGFGEKKVAHIKQGLEQSKERPYRQVLTSLGLPDVGAKLVELLIENGYLQVEQLFELVMPEDVEKLCTIKGIGEKSATHLIMELQRPETRTCITELQELGLQFTEEVEEIEETEIPAIFANQSWCITGSFEHFKPRSLAAEEVKKRGGSIVSGVSGKTTHLLAGVGAGSKLQKAESLGTTVVEEFEFLKMLAEPEDE